MVAIIDYGAGNIRSVEQALNYLGIEYVLTSDANVIKNADRAILPGVGNFKDAMDNLSRLNLIEPIKAFVETGKPFLGICLGLQLLFDESEESPGVKGLSLLKGKCLKIPASKEFKVPQIGWNSLSFPKECELFKGISEGAYVYFVHSYYLCAEDEACVAATTDYGVKIHAAVAKDNIYACQFHPEKSSGVGLKILENFVNL